MAEARCSGLEEGKHVPKARWGTRREPVPVGGPGPGSRSCAHSFVHSFRMTENVHVSGALLCASRSLPRGGPVSGQERHVAAERAACCGRGLGAGYRDTERRAVTRDGEGVHRDGRARAGLGHRRAETTLGLRYRVTQLRPWAVASGHLGPRRKDRGRSRRGAKGRAERTLEKGSMLPDQALPEACPM